jgi:hypothetical protein
MKITRLEAENWLHHPHLAIDFAPMTIICGSNARGKTAVVDAIAFAFKTPTHRLLSDRKALLTEGTEKGSVRIAAGAGWIKRDIASGKSKAEALGESLNLAALEVAIDPSALGDMHPDALRKALMSVMGTGVNIATATKALEARGYGPLIASSNLPSNGTVEDWHMAARAKAQGLKGEWRQITGEQYGSIKALTWRATRPAALDTDPDIEAALAEMKAANDELGAAQVELGGRGGGVPASGPMRDRLERLAASLDAALADLADAEQAHAQYADEHMCPACGVTLRIHRHIEGTVLSEVPGSPDMEGLRNAVAVAQDARAKLDSAADPAVLEQREVVARAQLRLDQARITHERVRRNLEALAAAEKAEKDAGSRHEKIVQWTEVAALLDVDGIPAELLTAALDPLNVRLRGMASETNWRQVSIGPDMVIRAGGRPYGLLSRSEKWRANACLAVAMAIESRLRFVCLDEFDLLEVGARQAALGWLYGLVKDNRLDTVIIVATLKAPPAAPAAVKVVWMDDAQHARRSTAA